jgi:hypothetical protein
VSDNAILLPVVKSLLHRGWNISLQAGEGQYMVRSFRDGSKSGNAAAIENTKAEKARDTERNVVKGRLLHEYVDKGKQVWHIRITS